MAPPDDHAAEGPVLASKADGMPAVALPPELSEAGDLPAALTLDDIPGAAGAVTPDPSPDAPRDTADTAPAQDSPAEAPDAQTSMAWSETPMALIDLGAARIGIDVCDLREVMPAPDALQPFQSTAPGIVGCVALRGQVVPVVDLAPLIGLPSIDPGAEGGVIVIVGDMKQVYGIAACAALQIVQARDCVPQTISRDDTALVDRLLPRLVLINDDAIGVLDAQALPALGVPRSRSDRAPVVERETTCNFLLFETEGIRFCLPVSDIQATLPEVSIDRSILCTGASEGGVLHNGIERALLNLSRFLGMSGTSGAGAPVSRASAVLLSRGEETPLALRADRVCDILSLGRSDIARMPSLLSPRPDLFAGVHMTRDNHEIFVLDGRALAADPELASFGALQHSTEDADPAAERPGLSGPGAASDRPTELALLVVAGAQCALEVAHVEEIVLTSAQMAERWAGGSHYLGNITSRRGLLIPTFSLAAGLGLSPSTTEALSAIIVIRRGDEQVGLLVDEIRAFERMRVMSDGTDGKDKILQRRRTDDQSLWQVVQPEALPLHVG